MKKNKKSKKNYDALLAFFLPIIAFVFVVLAFHLYKYALFFSDLRVQYIGFFTYFKDVILNNHSLYYSFSNGLGGNMIGTVTYYLMSPFNLLFCLFKTSDYALALFLVVLLKLGMCSLTMHYYLKKHFNSNSPFLLIFSVCYALMMFNAVYYFHVMWFDVIYLTPLVLYGIDLILKGKSGLLYGIFLSLAIFSNYYFGYMLCLFSLVYFVYEYASKKGNIKSLVSFGISSVLAGVITSVILLPSLLMMFNTAKNNFNLKDSLFVFETDFLNLLMSCFMGTFTEILNMKYIYLYCGMLPFALVILYFLNNDIKTKEKILTCLLLGFFVLSYSWKFLNNVWHGFNSPNWFNYRYAVFISLFLLVISAKSYMHISKTKLKDYLLTALIITLLGISVIIYNFNQAPFIQLSVLFSILYLACLYAMNITNHSDTKSLLTKLLVVLVVLELALNLMFILKIYNFSSVKEYQDNINITSREYAKFKDDESYYRTYKNFGYTFNDSLIYNTKEVGSFNSTLQAAQRDFFNLAGVNVQLGSIYYDAGRTPLLDSLLGVKYLFMRDSSLDYDLIGTFKFSRYDGEFLYDYEKTDVLVYQNPYALSLGYMVPSDFKEVSDTYMKGEYLNPLEYQNVIAKTVIDKAPFTLIETSENEGHYEFTVNTDSDFYLTFYAQYRDRKSLFEIWVNNERLASLTSTDWGTYIIPNHYKIGDKVSVSVRPIDGGKLLSRPLIYEFSYPVLKELYDNLSTNQFASLNLGKRDFNTWVNATEDKSTLLITLPYEKGWTFYVDDVKVPYYNLLNGLIGVDLGPGMHSVRAVFFPPGLGIGLMISLLTLLISFAYYHHEQKTIKFFSDLYEKYQEIILYLIVGAITTLVSVVSYRFFRIFITNYLLANFFSWVIAVIVAYILNRLYVFKSKSKGKKLLKEFISFTNFRIFSLGVDMAFMYMMVSIFKIDEMAAKILVQILVIVLNYFFSKFIIFKKS